MNADELRAALWAFVSADNPDAEHEGLAHDSGGSGAYAVADVGFIGTAAERIEVEKFVTWYTRPIGVRDHVRIVGTAFTGQVMAEVGGRLVVELEGRYDTCDVMPAARGWLSEAGTVFWPCLPAELQRAY
jgi:hypothetical protein